MALESYFDSEEVEVDLEEELGHSVEAI